MRTLLRVFFHFLYHQLAFVYDLVAASVSFGHWKNWILEVVPFIKGTRTLELGHGPGHLQRFLLDRGLDSVAIDESASMGRLAKRNLLKAVSLRGVSRSNLQNDMDQPIEWHTSSPWSRYALRKERSGLLDQRLLAMTLNLTCGLGQQLPFADQAFDTVIATFPAEYISEARTLSEVRRCLSDGGRFIVLPVAMPKSRFLSWLYKVTGETPSNVMEFIKDKMEKPFTQAGFDVETKLIERESGTLVILVGNK